MSARARRRRQAVKPAAVRVQAAAKPLNRSKSTPGPATRLPASLQMQLDDIERQAEELAEAVADIAEVVALVEIRLGAVEQLSICPMACARERCAFRCPIGGAQ